MPNRILRDAILTSERVATLDWASEVFYRRLHSIADDYGRHEAGHQLLRAKCYPLQTDSVRVADIARWMAACQKSGLILVYGANGKQYLEVCDFGQQIRSASKCPAPASNCNQLLANEHLGVCGGVDEGGGVERTPRKVTTKAKTAEVTLPEWIAALDGDAVPADDPLFAWAAKQGIPPDWLAFAWAAFEDRYTENGKTYADWRASFRTHVKRGWLDIWRLDTRTGGFVLTTAGEQWRREVQS